jgi:hypothetical protein
VRVAVFVDIVVVIAGYLRYGDVFKG